MFLLLFLSVLLMSGMFLAVLWFREQGLIAETTAQLAGAAPEDLENALSDIRRATFHINLVPGIVIIFLKAAILASVTMLISTFATSGIFAMITATAVYFIGHLQATARDFWLAGTDPEWWTRILLALVALLFPDFQMFTLADDVVAGTPIPWEMFWQILALGGVYLVVYYVLAAFIFAGREL